MRKLTINKEPYNTTEIKRIMLKQKDIRLFRNWYLIYYILKFPGYTVKQYSDILAFGIYNIYRIVKLYNDNGIGFAEKLNWGGRRKLSYEREEVIITRIKRKKQYTIKALTKEIEKELGSALPPNYIEKLIEKHELVIPYDHKKKAKR